MAVVVFPGQVDCGWYGRSIFLAGLLGTEMTEGRRGGYRKGYPIGEGEERECIAETALLQRRLQWVLRYGLGFNRTRNQSRVTHNRTQGAMLARVTHPFL